MPDRLSARFEAATHRLIGRTISENDRFGLAVSGGADSMAMLSLAARCWPGQIEVATVDHALRSASRDEAAMVSRWCDEQSISHATLTPDHPITGNIQSEARALRYRLLETWRKERGLTWLLTAHHADDQIETILLRLNRGSGLSGLRSIRPRRDVVLRPLIEELRADLRAHCVANSVPFVDDPSNADERFDRARLRAALADRALIDPAGLARSIEALSEADDALEWVIDDLEAKYVVETDGALVLERTDFPQYLLRQLLLRMIAKMHPAAKNPRGPSVDQALVQLFGGKVVALADCIVAGGTAWTVRRAPSRRRSDHCV